MRRSRATSSLPRDTSLDSTLALLREGYTFISSRARRLQSDVFLTRLMLQPAICMTGEEAAREFYVPGRFTRSRAVPMTTLTLLQDRGSVLTLDGDAHRRRKQLFISAVMAPDRVEELVALADREWRRRIPAWQRMPVLVLHDEVREILCRAVCAWAGVPLPESDARDRAREFGAMVDQAGSIGPRHWHAQWLRRRTERWIGQVIDDVRSGHLVVHRDRAAHAIASHRDADGRLLPRSTAAVELINVLRPTVAVARFITFAALALFEHPAVSTALKAGSDEDLDRFAQEVRRFYPFIPAVGGRVRTPFEWRGHRFKTGEWVLLDIHGTNHDRRRWPDPEEFRPDRFKEAPATAFDVIPQGGGGHADGHRCPGEAITLALMKAATRQLLRLRYDVPAQDLRIDLASVPALPASGFVIANVRGGGLDWPALEEPLYTPRHGGTA
jgi:fatty-acid peroxygenase